MGALRFAVVVSTWVAVTTIGACLAPGDPCCEDDLECVAGARCFEGRCAPRCDEHTPCEEGFECVEEALVCARAQRNEERGACEVEEPSR